MKLSQFYRTFGGAVAGALIGYVVFAWLVKQGFYALAIPGAGLGLGCGLSSKQPSVKRGIVCGILAILLGFIIEWKFFPFIKDDSLGYYILHIHELKPVTLVMVAVGGIFSWYFGKGRLHKTN